MLTPRNGWDGDQHPYFFLSYAHTPRTGSSAADPNMWVERLYQDLCEHILELTDLRAGTKVGFMDRDIRTGEGWSDRLAESLATCRVFVPLFSRRYFTSAQCGKEWYAFQQRAIQHHTRSNLRTEAIVPALWTPVAAETLPSAAEKLQFNHRAFGDRYTTEGFYGLIKVSMFHKDYELAVYELAKHIVQVAETSRIDPGQPVDYRRIPSAFGTPRGSRNLRITVAAATRDHVPEGRSAEYYGERATDWNPFYPEAARPLAAFTADLADSFDYQCTLASFDEQPDPPEGPAEPDCPEVMLVDRWAVADPERRERLGRLDRARPWVGVVVPWNRGDTESRAREAELVNRLSETMPNKTAQGPPGCRAAAHGVHSLESLTDLLPQVVEWSAAQYLKYARAYPPDGPVRERFRLAPPDAVGPPDPPDRPIPPPEPTEDPDDDSRS